MERACLGDHLDSGTVGHMELMKATYVWLHRGMQDAEQRQTSNVSTATSRQSLQLRVWQSTAAALCEAQGPWILKISANLTVLAQI